MKYFVYDCPKFLGMRYQAMPTEFEIVLYTTSMCLKEANKMFNDNTLRRGWTRFLVDSNGQVLEQHSRIV